MRAVYPAMEDNNSRRGSKMLGDFEGLWKNVPNGREDVWRTCRGTRRNLDGPGPWQAVARAQRDGTKAGDDKKPDRTHIPESSSFKVSGIMSISIDDLANSLNASHVGQEALDLAALQVFPTLPVSTYIIHSLLSQKAHLAKTLFGSSVAHSSSPQRVSRKTSFSQPCNTPTYTNFAQFADSQAAAAGPSWAVDDMEEDERMVEDLLLPRSPNSSSTLQFSLPLSTRPTTHLSSNNQISESSSTSSFTSTDPFYLAQLQAQPQNPPTATYSPFAELGKLPQHSPFSPTSAYRDHHHHSTNVSTAPLSLETHSFLVASAFDY
ncbi:hypothetical protein C0995_015920 [Termitomyces sp. Mi166|nr:hypothetical protein C0995_015920 [Termitomyces sp. Mi166\